MLKNNIDKRYLFLTIILLILGSGLLLLPKVKINEGISPTVLLTNINSSERYISTDALANKIISNDPSFLLIDLRDEASYKNYSIPNAIHIPFADIFKENGMTYLDQDQYDVILYSNDHYIADQAWLLCNRRNYENLYVLKGGLNQWYNTILNPKKPTENMPLTAYNTYDFRKAASMYFGVGYPEPVFTEHKKATIKKVVPRKVVPIKKKKKYESEGGC